MKIIFRSVSGLHIAHAKYDNNLETPKKVLRLSS